MNNNPRSSVVLSRNRGAFQIALLYLTIGVLWILFSDEAAARLAPNQAVLTQISIYKGWGFVLVTALLLYWMINLHIRRISRAEWTLSESEKNYKELLQQASDGIFIADSQGNYTLVNEEACRLVGYTKDELLSMNLRELIAPEDIQNTPPRLDELRNGKTLLTERILLRKDGSRILCEISAKQLPNGRYQSIIRDITERKVTEAALRRSEKRYRSLFENMTNGFSRCQMLYENDVPTDFVYLDINDAFKKLTGLQDVIGKRVSAVIPGIRESNPELFEIYGRVALTGKPEKFETHVPGLGSGIWFSVSVYSTEKDFFVAVFETITERKQAEAKLHDSEEQYRLMFTNNPLPMWVFDRETFAFLAVNDATVAQYGYSRAELLQMTIKDIRPPEDIPALQKIVAVKSAPYLNVGVYRHRKKDGTLIDVEITRHDILFDGHEALIILANDVTERKRVEEALRQSEQKYTLLFEKSAVPTVVLKLPEVVIFDANEACEKLTGFTRGEMLGKTSVQLGMFGTERRKELISRFESQGELTGNEVRLFAKNGKEHIVLTNTTPLKIDGQMYAISTMQDITERKRAEAQLEYQAHLLSNVSDAIIATDEKQVITSWNHAAEDLYGWKTEEALGKLAREVIRSEFTEVQRAEALKALAESGQFRVETLQYHRNGQAIWVEGHTIALRDDIGKMTGFISVNRDITERKRAEAALRESEERLRLSLHAANQGLYDLNVQTGDAFVNREYAEMLGYDADTFVETNAAWIERLHPDDQEITAKAYTNYVNGLTSEYRVEFRQRTKTGEWKWILSLGKVVEYDPAGKPLRMLGTHTDITERKQAEDELRQSQENFAKAFNSNPAAIAITRLVDGKFININPAYTRIMEYEPHELLGHTAAEMNIYVHAEERAQVIRQLREHGTVQNYELLVRIKSGETRSIVVSMEPLLYNAEECILSVFIDISDRKKMELELQRSNAELEQFAYVASHDLQEPLRAVAGMVQLLGQRYQGKLDERADEYIGHAVEASTRMQKLINDLLDYSRVNRLGRSFENTDVERSLNTALANLQLTIQESQAQITRDPLPTLMADAGQLTQLLQNLIGNAIKFRGAGPLHIHIGAKKIEQAWQFEISDNGIGIESKYFERIFLVFQRLHTRREYPGTGIGLALCKKIIERHNGQIWVESQPGLGSTFYFTIPERQP